MTHIAIIIPTLNAGDQFIELLNSITLQKACISKKIIIDSQSSDNTVRLAQKYQYEVLYADKGSFNHGRTRQFGIDSLKDIDIAVFLTQDVILHDEDSIGKLVASFSNPKVGAAYGRQLPHRGASSIAAQARLYNYPQTGQIKSYADKNKLGIKTAFLSDSFAAYRISDLNAVGGFPRVIICEDMYVAAKMLMQGYLIAYVADACVYHSHDYTLRQEFHRCFDSGVFQAQEPWIRAEFGGAESEGLKLVKAQLRYLVKNQDVFSIPKAILGNAVKIIAYRMGIYERYLPIKLKKILSAQSYYFK